MGCLSKMTWQAYVELEPKYTILMNTKNCFKIVADPKNIRTTSNIRYG